MTAGELRDASDIEFEALQRELLVDGWMHDDPATGLVQAVIAYAPERVETGPRAAPGSRVPWRGSATVFMLDLTNDVFRLLDEAEDQALGRVRASQRAVLGPAMDRLGVLLPKVDDGLRNEILERLRWHSRRARLLLEEDRPDRFVPLACSMCDSKHLLMRPLDWELRVYCPSCRSEWGEDELHWLSDVA